MFQANRMITNNGGQVDTSNAGPTRHTVPEAVSGTYHQSAQYFGAMVERNTNAALQAAILNERDNLARGMQRSESLDLGFINEHVGLHTGRELVENWHGDSAFSSSLAKIASASGPPSTFTMNPNTGEVFSARGIPSSNRNHRQYNNRLTQFTASASAASAHTSASASASTSVNKSKNLYPFGDSSSVDNRKPAARKDPTAPTSSKRNSTAPIVTTQKKSRAPSEASINRSLIQTLDSTLNTVRSAQPPATATKPPALNNVDTAFIDTPIAPVIQSNPAAAFSNDDEDSGLLDVYGKEAYIDELLERALARSFDETGVAESVFNVDTGKEETNDIKARAERRVHFIIDDRGKAHQLTELFVDRAATEKFEVNSPSVNKMLDQFNKHRG